MSSMSYCRFQNILIDLEVGLENLDLLIEKYVNDGDEDIEVSKISQAERDAVIKMFKEFLSFLTQHKIIENSNDEKIVKLLDKISQDY